MITTNSNIDLISFQQLSDLLEKSISSISGLKLIEQIDCDESLSYARVSLLQGSNGTVSGRQQSSVD
ncbi:hypothetical protein WNY58_16300 [Neptuniibacter pectenicola]|uniref:Uncharacterized protein n=1 Tax=Neptuniibacter pectenicola TaxID=1806669 RepID=A0ABU9TW52_9GAMM